jgi:soluble lytic murein transglycosylase-like protein
MGGITPALPPYGHYTAPMMQCVAAAAQRYQVPELLLHALLAKEGGRLHQRSRNQNGTEDLGPAQINSSWLAHFARYGITGEHLLGDFCINVYAAAYVLRSFQLRKGGDLYQAIVAYNIGPNSTSPRRIAVGHAYARDVVAYWWEFHRRAVRAFARQG